MEAVHVFEISVNFFKTKRLHSPEDGMSLAVVNTSHLMINSAKEYSCNL
jgi:hypothetical protein